MSRKLHMSFQDLNVGMSNMFKTESKVFPIDSTNIGTLGSPFYLVHFSFSKLNL